MPTWIENTEIRIDAHGHIGLDICPVVEKIPGGSLRFAGTAFRVGHSQWFVTAAHVLDGLGDDVRILWLQEIAGEETPFFHLPVVTAVERLAPWTDLALIRVPRAGRPSEPLTIDASPERRVLGDTVWTFGFPLTQSQRRSEGVAGPEWTIEFEPRLLRGNICRVFGDSNRERAVTLELDFLLGPGISGAPIMIADNSVVGVALGTRSTQYDRQHYAYGYAAPLVGFRDQIMEISGKDEAPPRPVIQSAGFPPV